MEKEQLTPASQQAAPNQVPAAGPAGLTSSLKKALKGATFEEGRQLLSPGPDATGGGRPDEVTELPASVKGRVKGDLSGVRVIQNSTLAKGKGVAAFSRGDEIHVAQGRFADGVLLHEVAHTLQQRKGRGSKEPPKGNARALAESEAEQAAAAGFVDTAALTPVPQGEYALQFGDLAGVIAGIQGKAGTAVSAQSGVFVDAAFTVDVIIPNIPGLNVSVKAGGTYTQFKSGQKELALNLGVGVKYKFAGIFNVNAYVTSGLTLKGNDLGAAFVDALKQTVYYQLEVAGVHQQFAEMYRIANEGPGLGDWAKCFIPFYGNVHAAKMIAAAGGRDNIVNAYKAFRAFFANNAAVGFEASVGFQVGGAGQAKGATGAEVALGAKVGLEDVNNNSTKGFAEVGGELEVRKGNTFVRGRVSKRWTEGGKQVLKVGFTSGFDIANNVNPYDKATKVLSTVFGDALFGAAMSQLASQKEGGNLGSFTTLANYFLDVAAMGGLHSENIASMAGLDITLQRTNGTWDKVSARLKSMTQVGTGRSSSVSVGAASVKANVSAGSFLDVSADLRKLLG